MLGLDIVYIHAKFDHSSFSRSGDMVQVTLTTQLLGIVCYPWANTCYDQPMYKIWSLYLYPLQRYERWYKI